MKRTGKWLAKVVGRAIGIVIVIVLLPYAARLAGRFLPDLSDRAVTASQILSQRFEESARLETMKIEEDGILSSSTNALFLGTVQQVSIHYRYEASLGVDLRKVTMVADGNRLILTLPPMELIADSLTPLSINRDDFWYPLTDKQRQSLLDRERLACRERHLREQAESEEAWRQTCRMFDETIAQWLVGIPGVRISYERPDSLP